MTQNQFAAFIDTLAPEGEKALFGIQKTTPDGESYFPTNTFPPNSALYANTGSFIKERMNGHDSATAANIEHCLFLMLDDIGTKAKTPPLEPTWKIETSPGNYQWGYAYSERPTKGAQAVAVSALAAAGYSDPGASNAVRWSRIPGSVNKRKKFTALLRDFHPDRRFTLPQICAALGVVPDAAMPKEAKSSDSNTVKYATGSRNNALTSIAGAMRKQGLDAVAIAAALHVHNQAVCDPPLPDNEVDKIAQSVERYPADNVPPSNSQFKAVVKPEDVVAMSYPKPPAMLGFIELFPEVLREHAAAIANNVGCDIAIPIMAGLSAVSGAVDKRIQLELIRDYLVPPIIWAMVIGDPGDKKSPGSKPMFAPLRKLEQDDKVRYQMAMQKWSDDIHVFEKRNKAKNDAAAKLPAPLPNDAGAEVVLPPVKPVALRVLVEDATSQKILSMLGEGYPRGLLALFDEMARALEAWNVGAGSENRGNIVKGYDGGPCNLDRVGKEGSAGATGTLMVENNALPIFGGLQHDIYRANAAGLSTDGMLQRFIPVVTHGSRVGTPTPDFMLPEVTSKARWEQLIETIYKMPVVTHKLSPEAVELFIAWQYEIQAIQDDLKMTGASFVVRTSFAKLEGMSARITLLFHLIELASGKCEFEVSADTTGKAIAFCRGYIASSIEYVDEVIVSQKSFLQWMADHILHYADQRKVTLSHLRRAARRQLNGISEREKELKILNAMDELAERGWVMLLERTPNSMTWAINPVLITAYVEYRKKVIDAKQRAEDRRREIVLKTGATTPRKIVHGYDNDTK